VSISDLSYIHNIITLCFLLWQRHNMIVNRFKILILNMQHRFLKTKIKFYRKKIIIYLLYTCSNSRTHIAKACIHRRRRRIHRKNVCYIIVSGIKINVKNLPILWGLSQGSINHNIILLSCRPICDFIIICYCSLRGLYPYICCFRLTQVRYIGLRLTQVR